MTDVSKTVRQVSWQKEGKESFANRGSYRPIRFFFVHLGKEYNNYGEKDWREFFQRWPAKRKMKRLLRNKNKYLSSNQNQS